MRPDSGHIGIHGETTESPGVAHWPLNVMARPRVAPSPRRRLRTLRQEESKRKGTQITAKNANDVRPVAARGLPSALLWHKAAASTRPFAFFAVICVPLRLKSSVLSARLSAFFKIPHVYQWVRC